MPLGLLFLNRTHRADFHSKGVDRLEHGLTRLRGERERAIAQEALHRAREELGWTAINDIYRRRLANEVEMPIVEVPFIFAEEFGSEQVRAVTAAIESVLVPASRGMQRSGNHGGA